MLNKGATMPTVSNKQRTFSNPFDDDQRQPAGPVMTLQLTLVNMGRNRAIDGGVLKPRDTDIKSLSELAASMAKETKREIFNPHENPEHRLRHDEHLKVLADREDIEDGVKY